MILPVSLGRPADGERAWMSLGLSAVLLFLFLLQPDGGGWSGWGLVPSNPRPAALLTHLFVHAGWTHVAANLLALLFAGPAVERRWGPLPFAAFFLAAGALVGGLFALRYPASNLPLVGASGSLAGLLGAFLVHFGRSRLEFAVLIPGASRVVAVPAWVILGLWLGSELLGALSQETRGGTLAGVAYWTHVWGFGLGVAAAVVVRGFDRGSEPAAGGSRPRGDLLALAFTARRQGRDEEAAQLLEKALRLNPEDEAARDVFWELSRKLGRLPRAQQLVTGPVRQALHGGRPIEALDRWQRLRRSLPGLVADPALGAALAEAARRNRRTAEGEELLAQTVAALGPEIPAATLERLLRLATPGSPTHGRLLELAKAQPELAGMLRSPSVHQRNQIRG